MRTGIYARVSTPFSIKKEEEKIKQTQDINNQVIPLIEFINNKGWTHQHTYLDYATGKNTNRPMFQELMKDAFQAKFDCVIVWKLDRFARSMQDFINSVKELDRLKIRFICLTQNIDTDSQSSAGRLLMNMLASFAEFERELIVERIKASIDQRRAKGESLGRPKVICNKEKLWNMHYIEGMSIRKVAFELGLTRSTVKRRIKEYGSRLDYVPEKEDLEIETFDSSDVNWDGGVL